MKRKLLFVAALAAVLTAAGTVVLLRATFTHATPTTMPVQPFTIFNSNTMESTALGASSESRAVGGTPSGARLNTGTSFSYRFGGAADTDIPDGYEAAWITSETEVFCDGTVDLLAKEDNPPYGPYPAFESTTNVDSDGVLGTDPEDYVRFNSPLWSMVARYVIPLDGLWLGGPSGFFYDMVPDIPVNSISMQVPWNPLSQAAQVTLAGNPAPPSGICTDSPLSTVTITVATDNPPLQGDSGGPCADCTDVGITGWWPDPGSLTASGAVTVKERVHNNGPVAGTFKVWWEFEAPDGVTGAWVNGDGDTIVDNTLTFTGSSGTASTSTLYTRTLNLTCDDDGSYLVALKNIWYPLGAKDQNLADNAATTMIQLECGDVSGLTPVDKEVIWVMPRASDQVNIIDGKVDVDENGTADDDLADVALSLLVGGRDQVDIIDGKVDVDENGTADDDLADVFLNLANAGADVVEIIDGQIDVDENGTADDDLADVLLSLVRPDAPDHLQLVEGETATVMVDELKAYHPDEGAALASADGVETLVAETVDQTKIEAKWVSSGSSVLTETVSEPAGEQVRNIENLVVKCLSGSADLAQPQPVVLKAIDRPGAGLRETRPGDNVQYWVINVWCFEDSAARTAAKDTIDDGTGLYLRWGTYTSYADVRKSGKAGADVGSPGDTSYQEYMVVPECFWLDADGGTGENLDTDDDGYISAAESQQDPDIPGGGYADIDSDGDCLIDPAFAQPGQPVDSDDEPNSVPCPALVYSESGGNIKVQYDTAADQDCDGLTDGVEAGWTSDPTQSDTDNDGASDFLEMRYSTNPGNPDTDYDAIKDKPDDDYVNAPVAGTVLDSGTAESGTANTLTDDDKVWALNWWTGNTVKITSGTGAGQQRTITGNTQTPPKLTVGTNWATNPDATSQYQILSSGSEPGEAVQADDNCPNAYNPDQTNFDGQRIANGPFIPTVYTSNPNADTKGDACDTDDDNDSISDVAELAYATQVPNPPGGGATCTLNPLDSDTDGDRALDGVEHQLGSNPCVAGATAGTLDGPQTVLFRGGGINVPAQGAYGGVWDAQNDMDTSDNREKNADADYKGTPHDAAHSVNSFGDAGTDKDNDDGSNGSPSEILDITEVKGYNTAISRVDTDGDGCADWIEIADVNGDRVANLTDVYLVAQAGPGNKPTVEPDKTILDINKNRAIGLDDVYLTAKNSALVMPPASCLPSTSDAYR